VSLDLQLVQARLAQAKGAVATIPHVGARQAALWQDAHERQESSQRYRGFLFQRRHTHPQQLCKLSCLKIQQRGLQWKQGAVIRFISACLFTTQCTPLPLHPPTTANPFDEYPLSFIWSQVLAWPAAMKGLDVVGISAIRAPELAPLPARRSALRA